MFLCGSQFLLSVTLSVFDSSSLNDQMNASLSTNLGDTGVRTMYLSHCRRMLYHWSKSTWDSWLYKAPCLYLYTRNLVDNFPLDLTTIFLAFLIRMPTEALPIVFPCEEILRSRDLAYRRWKPYHSFFLSLIVKFDSQSLYVNILSLW